MTGRPFESRAVLRAAVEIEEDVHSQDRSARDLSGTSVTGCAAAVTPAAQRVGGAVVKSVALPVQLQWERWATGNQASITG